MWTTEDVSMGHSMWVGADLPVAGIYFNIYYSKSIHSDCVYLTIKNMSGYYELFKLWGLRMFEYFLAVQ